MKTCATVRRMCWRMSWRRHCNGKWQSQAYKGRLLRPWRLPATCPRAITFEEREAAAADEAAVKARMHQSRNLSLPTPFTGNVKPADPVACADWLSWLPVQAPILRMPAFDSCWLYRLCLWKFPQWLYSRPHHTHRVQNWIWWITWKADGNHPPQWYQGCHHCPHGGSMLRRYWKCHETRPPGQREIHSGGRLWPGGRMEAWYGSLVWQTSTMVISFHIENKKICLKN